MDYGPDENGRRIKKYKTFSNLPLARKALKEFHTERESQRSVTPSTMTLDQWLDYWMDIVIKPNRAKPLSTATGKSSTTISPPLWEASRCRSWPRAIFSSTTPP